MFEWFQNLFIEKKKGLNANNQYLMNKIYRSLRKFQSYCIGSVNGSDDLEPIRIIHKDHEALLSFCLNNNSSGIISLASPREIQELDITMLLESPNWYEDECDYEVLSKEAEPLSTTGFLVIQTQEQ